MHQGTTFGIVCFARCTKKIVAEAESSENADEVRKRSDSITRKLKHFLQANEARSHQMLHLELEATH